MTKGEQAVPWSVPAAAGPSADAAVPPFYECDGRRTKVRSGRAASGEDAALASAFGLRLGQRVKESACRTGGRKRHDHVLLLTGLAEPQRAERRRRRRRPRRLPSRTPCTRPKTSPPQNAAGGQDDACRRPRPHGAAARGLPSGPATSPSMPVGNRRGGMRRPAQPRGRREDGAPEVEDLPASPYLPRALGLTALSIPLPTQR